MKPTILSWSTGKDSAWTLHVLQQSSEYKVVGLLTTVNAQADRVAMHAVRRSLLDAQARATGLPLTIIPLPWPCCNHDYESLMLAACRDMVMRGATTIAFGDLFLADVRSYREKQLAGTGLEPCFPLWKLPTDTLGRDMIAGGLRARLTCIDPQQIPVSFAGREFDTRLLADLPSGIDPCGERGEFHTFCYAGPMFSAPLEIQMGETVERDGFVFTDVMECSSRNS